MKKAERELFQSVIEQNGVDHQIDRAIEEMAELTKALLKHRRYGNGVLAVAEEIADVLICMDELQIIFGELFINEKKMEKLERLERMVEAVEPAPKQEQELVFRCGKTISNHGCFTCDREYKGETSACLGCVVGYRCAMELASRGKITSQEEVDAICNECRWKLLREDE